MNAARRRRIGGWAVGIVMALASVAVAQVVTGGVGFVTATVAGLGSTTTVAGESRIPVLARDVTWDAQAHQLHLRAVGHHGPLRQLDIDLHDPQPGQSREIGSGTSMQIQLETGGQLAATAGHANVTVTAFDDRHAEGRYEGTFQHGAVPVVVRGHFEVRLPHAAAPSAPPASP